MEREKKRGKLYGVGVGPGDPELLTLKALRVIKQCDVIAVPGKEPKETVAYGIAEKAFPEIGEKQLLGIYMPMTKNLELLKKSHEEGGIKLRKELDCGKTLAFLTLGDPTVYSTYMYLHKEIEKEGYEGEIVSGIPSFCAAAAKLDMSLAEKAEQIHIIPASYQIEESLKLSGTKIFMKAGKNIGQVKEHLKDCKDDIYMIENCGMEKERIFHGVDAIPDDAGYYTLMITKETEE